MTVKSKSKRTVKSSARSKAAVKVKEKTVVKKKLAPASKTTAIAARPVPKKETEHSTAVHSPAGKPPTPIVVKRVVTQAAERRRSSLRASRANQFNFMKAPGLEHAYEVGGGVEVFCDHEKNRERIRGWVRGIVVQVDNKMVAVQFRSNVYLTDGWMVPDRILWFPLNSEHMRLIPGKKPMVKDIIPEY